MKLRPLSSLRFKVVLVIFLTAAVALAMACAAFVAFEYSSVRSHMVTRLSALADVVGANCKSALAFADPQDAEKTLAGLRADGRFLAAAVYTPDGRLFARFARQPAEATLPASPPLSHATIAQQRVEVVRPILERGLQVGSIYLVADLASFEDQFRDFARAGSGVLLLALLVAALLAYRLQRIVADPVLRLVDAAKTVAASQDLAVRVEASSPDELGLLADTFNGMLGELERQDKALRESEARYTLSVRGAQDGLWDWDLERNEIYFAPRWKEMLGYDDSELPSRPEEWFDRIHPEDRNGVHAALDAHLVRGASHFEAEYRLRHRSGGWLWVFARALATRDASGRAVRIAGSQSDVTDRKGRDALTGLPNRLLFVDRVESALRRERAPDGVPFAVLVVELERLDLIQETLGRKAGRDLLLAAAERIQRALGPQDTLASLESGQFAVLLELRDGAEPSRMAHEIHRAMAPPFRIDEQEHLSAVAIGIAFSRTGYELAEEVVRDALAALSRARDQGWNQTEVFDERMRARAFARLELEDALRRAVDRGELVLHYQPILTLGKQRLVGFETLLRWERGALGPVAPEEFIAMAEACGIIVPLGGWVLRAACTQLSAWRAERPERTDLTLSVNISAHQLARLAFIEEVETALLDADLPARCLKLEITESVLVEKLEPVHTVLRELHKLGVGLWLDDFGTGYSNLSYLHRFPLEAMKIDRSFIAQLDGGNGQREIVGPLVALARNLGMKTIAEGVETPRQLQSLAGFDCDFVQGFALSRPLDAVAAAEFLRRHFT